MTVKKNSTTRTSILISNGHDQGHNNHSTSPFPPGSTVAISLYHLNTNEFRFSRTSVATSASSFHEPRITNLAGPNPESEIGNLSQTKFQEKPQLETRSLGLTTSWPLDHIELKTCQRPLRVVTIESPLWLGPPLKEICKTLKRPTFNK